MKKRDYTNNFKKHLTTIASATAFGTMSIAVATAITGCSSQEEKQVSGNKILTVEQQMNGKYVIVEEIPTSGPNKAILREYDENGVMHERLMSEAEMRQIAQAEYERMQNGTSELNQAPGGDSGMGLGGAILAGAAGALLGNMIGNALMNNKNFAQRANRVNQSPTHRAAKSSARSSSTQKKSFFGNSSGQRSTSSSSRFGG